MGSPTWDIEEYEPSELGNLHRLTFDIPRVGDEFHILCISDAHVESTLCDWPMLRRHLDEAKRRGAPVLSNGDWFDVMQGKFDRRSDHSELNPELVGRWNGKGGCVGYLDRCESWAADFLEPYKEVLGVWCQGNHETAMLNRHGHDMTGSLVARMRDRGAKQMHAGGYRGYIALRPRVHGYRASFDLFYHHGHGGGGPVTGAAIQMQRRQVYAEADIIWSGHVHDDQFRRMGRIRRTKDMLIEEREVQHISTPGYKKQGAWEIERGMPPKPRGACWLRFSYHCVGNQKVVTFDVRQAK